MARTKSPTFTDGELRLMAVLWDKRRATAAEVHNAITGPRRPAYNSVLTMLRVLERKGYIHHEKAGRAFIFYPLIDRASARRRALRYLLTRFFDNSPELLVLNVLEHELISDADLRRLRKRIDESD